MSDRFYDLEVAGVKRKLPILNLPSEKLAIAGFNTLGDVELTSACAKALAARVPKETEILLTAEAKGITLASEMAQNLGMKRFVIARKAFKAYMKNPVWVEDISITTRGKQILVLAEEEIELVKGHKILLVDDVISTGGSMRAMRSLVEKVGGTVIGEAAVLAEGDAAKRTDIIFLEPLPLFDPE